MALRNIKIENFRGAALKEYQFGQTMNLITGKNGSGKSTIKEAVCFGFTGTDSSGNRNPQHLITDGEDYCCVSITTDKAEISRTLTRKGNGTLKVIKNGVASTFTQSQFEMMLCSTDLFLSAFIPGFFLDLTTERQHKVISEIRPKIDRDVLFAELAGFELSQEEKLRYGLSRRSDLVASQVASDRRELEKQILVNSGRIDQLNTLVPLPKPEAPAESLSLSRLTLLKSQWESYKLKTEEYQKISIRAERIQNENAIVLRRKKEIEAQLASIKIPQIEEPDFVDVESLRKKLILLPQKPLTANVVETDNCPTCGQTVGLKHRERVKKKNEELLTSHNLECDRVQAINNKVNEEISVAIAENKSKIDASAAKHKEKSKILEMKQALEVELAGLREEQIPEVPEKPTPPESLFVASEFDSATAALEKYNAAVAQYNYVSMQIKNASEEINKIAEQTQQLQSRVDRLRAVENVVKRIPTEEITRQKFEVSGIDFVIGEDIKASVMGIPYKQLSTGQAMKADVRICKKINTTMPRPLGMIFLDNADLVDELEDTGLQMFTAEVSDGLEVEVRADHK